MLPLLFKSSVVIIALFAFYKLILERESFFHMNRMYLLSILFFAALTPFLSLPKVIDQQGVLSYWLEPIDSSSNANQSFGDHSIQIDGGETIAQEVLNLDDSESQSETASESPLSDLRSGKSRFDYLKWLYIFGVGILLLNLLLQISTTLWKVYNSRDKIENEDGTIINLSGKVEPCSFFNFIFINPTSYDYETYEQILAHESIHVRLKHSIDLICSEIAVAFLWFNPFVWFLRGEIEKNIEYQTDALMNSGTSEDQKLYQMNLVRIASYTRPLAITTNYNQSLIKSRIIKMNNKKSNPFARWKYAFSLPIIALLILLLNQPIDSFASSTPLPNPPKFMPVTSSEGEQQTQEEGPEYQEQIPIYKEENLPSCAELTQNLIALNLPRIKELLSEIDPNCYNQNPDYTSYTVNGKIYQLQNGHYPLYDAARTGDLAVFQAMLDAGADVQESSGEDGDAVIAAAEMGHLHLLKLLDKMRVNLDRKFTNPGSALTSASRFGHLEVVKYLVNQGSDMLYDSPNYGTPLEVARQNGHLDIVQFIQDRMSIGDQVVEKPTSFNSSSSSTKAIFKVAARGDIETMKFLLEKGTDINSVSRDEGTPLIQAANNGQNEMIRYLINQGADKDISTENQGNALIAAATNGKVATLELLINQGMNVHATSENQGNALIAASTNGHTKAIQYLLDAGADIHAKTNNQGSALIAAAGGGHLSAVELLLDSGARIDQKGTNQGTPLIAAVYGDQLKVIKFLVSKGADVGITHRDNTALDAAYTMGKIPIIKYLESLDK